MLFLDKGSTEMYTIFFLFSRFLPLVLVELLSVLPNVHGFYINLEILVEIY